MPFLQGPVDYDERSVWYKRLIDAVSDFFTGYRVFSVPLLNWGIIFIYLANLVRLSLHYRQLRESSALYTAIITNCLLYGLADTLAQTLRSAASFRATQQVFSPSPEPKSLFTSIIQNGRPRRVILDEEDDDLVELGLAIPQPDVPPAHPLAHPELFNFRRLVLFSAWGCLISFFQTPWYAFLNFAFGEGYRFISVLQRVLCDQLFYSPISLAAFFTYMAIILERGDWSDAWIKLESVYLKTLMINYTVWPAAQFFNFLVVPASLQIPFSSTVSVFWNAYLSLKNPT